ncbi:hypothetical protein Syun_025209 [Stephania yunnanensis]|uniref:Uncharacterized protein n=1 Tax=Stephania yunnanensis TaxID=152371 RepID=A0AAP0ERQ5_9MAGN
MLKYSHNFIELLIRDHHRKFAWRVLGEYINPISSIKEISWNYLREGSKTSLIP